MTLQNGLLTPGAAYIWTDTAAYSLEREFLHHDPKYHLGEGWPYALIHSGTSDCWDAVHAALKRDRPQSDTALARCIANAMQPFLEPVWGMWQRVLIASYAGKPRLTIISTESLGGYRPLQPVPIRTHMVSGYSEGIAREIARGPVTVDRMGRIIRAQHADSILPENWPLGGKVWRVCVSRDGVDVAEIDDLAGLTATAAVV